MSGMPWCQPRRTIRTNLSGLTKGAPSPVEWLNETESIEKLFGLDMLNINMLCSISSTLLMGHGSNSCLEEKKKRQEH